MPSPTSEAVADSFVTLITGLSLTPTPTSIRKMKRPLMFEGESGPLVIVSQGDGDTPVLLGRQSATLRRFLTKYPVDVILAQRNQGTQRENATLRGWNEAIDTAVLNWMTGLKANGLPTVNDVEARGQAMFDLPALMKGFDWAASSYTVEVCQDV